MADKPFEPSGTVVTITPDGGTDFVMEYITITPPGWDGGDAIDTTTLSNITYKTKMAAKLIDIGNMSFTAELDPTKIHAAPINSPATIEVDIPEVGVWTFRGHLKSITPNELTVGERATCSGEIIITNTLADGATESAPTWAPSATASFNPGSMTLAELRAIGTALDIEGASAMEAGPLITAIREALAA